MYDGKNMTISNTKLNLSSIYENYPYIGSNDLSIVSFIDDFKNNNGNYYEKDGMIILETNVKKENRYRNKKILYVDKNNLNKIKLEVQDINQNTLVYILYNEIKLNNIKY